MAQSSINKIQKVLLVGAFANGNLGDMYQADVIAHELRVLNPDLQIFSASPSKRASLYPARNHKPLASEILYDRDKVNDFDLMLIGGGGVLSAPHSPLNNNEWVKSIDIPMCTVAVGCAGATPLECQLFVEKCRLFSVRDTYSAAALGGLRNDAVINMDPILLGELPELTHYARPEKAQGVLMIPGKLVYGTMEYYKDITGNLMVSSSDSVVSFNPETDQSSGFANIFGNSVTYLNDVETFYNNAIGKRLCVSERYHGCIFSLKMHIPVIGLTLRSEVVSSKITELYRRLGLTKCLLGRRDPIERNYIRKLADSEFDFSAIDNLITAERSRLRMYLSNCLTLT